MGSITDYYDLAKDKYREIDINTDKAIETLKTIVFSMKCCDIVKVEDRNDTSDYKSEKANSPKLRYSLEKAFALIPGKQRVSLNAVHMDAAEYVELDEIEACHYDVWTAWAKKHTAGMDFYTSMVKHEKSDKGFALSDRNKDIRYFWVEHCQRCRIVGQYIGNQLKTPCITTININDFFESIPIESLFTQQLLVDSLNKIYSENRNKHYNLDSVFTGLGETKGDYMPVADENFCINYAIDNNLYVNIDTKGLGNEKQINNRLSSVAVFTDKIVINIQPSIDNTIVLNDKLTNLTRYIVNNNLIGKVNICLDFQTDADSQSKIKKWVLGTRAVQKAFLLALLEPGEYLKKCYEAKDYSTKIALQEEFKTYPFGGVWDYYCHTMNVPVGLEWLDSGNRMDK